MDRDGRDEVILWRLAATMNESRPTQIHVVAPDGTPFNQQTPVSLPLRTPDSYATNALIGGTLSYPNLDIFTAQSSHTYLYLGDATYYEEWPYSSVSTSGAVGTPMDAMADLNHDGKPETIMGTSGDKLVIRDGHSRSNTTLDVPGWFSTRGISAGDVDCDGEHEIAFFTINHVAATTPLVDSYTLHVIEQDGSHLPGYPHTFPTIPFVSAGDLSTQIADLDGDGDLELFVCYGTEIYAFDFPPCQNGQESAGVEWGQPGHDTIGSHNYHHDSGARPHYLFGDANYDGQVDISDVIRFLRVIEGNQVEYCERRLDFNRDHSVNIADITALVAYLFNNGTAPYGDHFPNCQKAGRVFYEPLDCKRYICH